MKGLSVMFRDLGIDPTLPQLEALPQYDEVQACAYYGQSRFDKAIYLTKQTLHSFFAMQKAAEQEHLIIEIISGFRSFEHQSNIIRQKLDLGLSLEEILCVNAAPGYSEHHSGRALDLSSPDEPALEDSFRHTDLYQWLTKHAHQFGFVESYPEDNPFGFIPEPWHWCFHPEFKHS